MATLAHHRKVCDERRAVVGADLEFDARLARVQADAVHALHAAIGSWSLHQTVTLPSACSSISIVHRHERRRPVMLRPVELDAAAEIHGPGQADQRGLDDGLVVDEIVAVGLVLQRVDAPADLRQDQHAENTRSRARRPSRRGRRASPRCGR